MNAMILVRPLVLPVLAGTLSLGAASARAEPFATLDRLDQGSFLELSESLGAATHYKAVAPAEALGIIGFDIGVEVSATEIDRALFDRASDEDFGTDQLLVPRLHAHKGLPFGLDVGASVGAVPDTDLTVIGGELRLALVEGAVAVPAVALRASYSRLRGADELDLDNAALELTVSKGFLMITPYAGVGLVRSEAVPLESTVLAEESFDQEKLFVGANVNFVGFNATVEIDRTGEYTSYSGKLGIRF